MAFAADRASLSDASAKARAPHRNRTAQVANRFLIGSLPVELWRKYTPRLVGLAVVLHGVGQADENSYEKLYASQWHSSYQVKWPNNRLFGQIVAKKSGLTTSSFLNSRE